MRHSLGTKGTKIVSLTTRQEKSQCSSLKWTWRYCVGWEVGTNGLIRSDYPLEGTPLTRSFERRTYPAVLTFWTYLTFANDEGIFPYKPYVPTKMVEIESQQDMKVIFSAFKEGVTQMSNQATRPAADSPVIPPAKVNTLVAKGGVTFQVIKVRMQETTDGR